MSSKIHGALLLAIITCFVASDALDDHGHLFSVRIMGTVFCDTCFKQHFSKNSYFISGASVVVECRNNEQTADFRTEAKTNNYGQFQVELVPSIFHSAKQLKRCSATLLQNEEQKDPCKLVSIANSSSFTLKSKQGNIHTYSAGFFSYRPQSPPPFCSQDVANDPKSGLKASLKSSQVSGLPPLLTPIFPSLPPLPLVPPLPPLTLPPLPLVPQLPPLPLVPPLPPLNVPPLPFPSLTPPSPLLPRHQNSFLSPPQHPLPNSFQPTPLIPNPFEEASKDLLPPIPLETPPLVPLPPLPPVEVPPLVPLPPLPPVEIPPLVPLPPLPPVEVPPLIPPAQSSLPNSFQSPPLIPNPFEAPSKDLLPPIPLETPPLVPLPPLPPVEVPPLVPLPPLPPIKVPSLVPLPPLPPVEVPPLVPLPPLPPLIPPAQFSPQTHN